MRLFAHVARKKRAKVVIIFHICKYFCKIMQFFLSMSKKNAIFAQNLGELCVNLSFFFSFCSA